MFKTNVDNILELLKDKKSLPIADIAKKLKTTSKSIQNTATLLEEEGILKIEYKFMKPYLTLIEKKKEAKTEDKKNDAPLEVKKDLLSTNLDVPQDKKTDKSYTTLNEGEIGDAEFPQEITSLSLEDEKKKKEQEIQQAPTVVVQMPDQYPEGIPEEQYPDEEQPKEDNYSEEQPQHEVSQSDEDPYSMFGGVAQGDSTGDDLGTFDDVHEDETESLEHEDTGGLQISTIMSSRHLNPDGLTEADIDFLIEKANSLMDTHDLDDITQLYKQIYDEFMAIEGIPEEERVKLKHKLGLLFDRIKKMYISGSVSK